MASELVQCRICKSEKLCEVIDLGQQIITSRFPKLGDYTTPSTKIRLAMCFQCNLVQLKDTTPSSELYEHMYGYRSGISNTMRQHLKAYNDEIQTYVTLHDNDFVLDIGSNDSTMLQNYSSRLHRIGCDPTGLQFIDYYHDVQLIPTYFTRKAIVTAFNKDVRFKVVSSISMFYDLPDPVQFAKDIHSVLDDNGIWTLEQSYVLTMLERNSIDTICHEHLEYYGVKQIKEIMDRSGFKIINITTNNCNGGSFRIYVCKQASSLHEECSDLIQTFLNNEEKERIHTPERYAEFLKACLVEVDKLKTFISHVNRDHKNVYIYGASTKGNCLLQFGKIDSSYIPYAVERNPLKYGRTTSTGIEIISEEDMRMRSPEYLLVLPWHFREEIIQRESEFLSKGGKLIFPFPTFEIYSNKPACIITGCNGQIAHYLIPLLQKEYNVYGITHTYKSKVDKMITIQNDMTNKDTLEQLITSICPASIVHLASMTNTEDCENEPLKTIAINGLTTAYMCDIIVRNKLSCSLFHASSSENYKGRLDTVIEDNDTDFKPTTMYGIAKTYGHQLIDYYRQKHGVPFSNGIIFTTESPLRKSSFLLKKLRDHAKEWHRTKSTLQLGSLDSFRNLSHASDIASAITYIIKEKTGNSYVLCNTQPMMQMEDIAIKIYAKNQITLVKEGNTFMDLATHTPVFTVGESFRGNPTKINGNPQAILKLGWKPMYSIDDIIQDICK